jgi:hypothetical protein
VDAGLVLQVDAPDIAIDASFASPADQRRRREASVAALNRALDGLPPARMRLHLCWGNYGGPHHFDVELDEFVARRLWDVMAAAGTDAGSPRRTAASRALRGVTTSIPGSSGRSSPRSSRALRSSHDHIASTVLTVMMWTSLGVSCASRPCQQR